MFLRQEGFTHMLFIDADEDFDENGILSMIEADKEIITAQVPTKGINWPAIDSAAENGQKDLKRFAKMVNFKPDENENYFEDKPVYEIEYGGAGIMLIKREVFEKMEPYCEKYKHRNGYSIGSFENDQLLNDFWPTGIDENQVYLSEDYAFCKKWKDLGGKIYMAKPFFVAHYGSHAFM
jgi:hypothetical protein